MQIPNRNSTLNQSYRTIDHPHWCRFYSLSYSGSSPMSPNPSSSSSSSLLSSSSSSSCMPGTPLHTM
ncbi:hypothetical protein KCU61_g206, partial [Aureobasidium melanogenum]